VVRSEIVERRRHSRSVRDPIVTRSELPGDANDVQGSAVVELR
jgi:hypothetical protein